jgi:hypothetical protein
MAHDDLTPLDLFLQAREMATAAERWANKGRNNAALSYLAVAIKHLADGLSIKERGGSDDAGAHTF